MPDNTTMQPSVATQPPSMPSSGVAPSVAYQPTPAPASQPSYQPQAPVSVQAPQASAPQANPWQEAFNRLFSENSIGTPSYQSQVPYSAPTQPVTPYPATYPSAPAAYPAMTQGWAPQTWQPQPTPAYLPPQVSPAVAPAPQSAPTGDEYLQNVSAESLEVLQHFGGEAPALLNRYACTVEDALLHQAQQTVNALGRIESLEQAMEDARTVIVAAAEDNAAYHHILTDPQVLAKYTSEFFGADGPYPVETSRDRLAADVAAQEARYQQPQEYVQSQQFTRPQMDMPYPGVQASGGRGDFLSTFSQMYDSNPAAAAQFLLTASPDDLRSKLLVTDG